MEPSVEEVKLWMGPQRSCCRTRDTHPKVMFCIVKEKPDLPVAVGQEDLLQGDHVGMIEFSQQLEDTRRHKIGTTHTCARAHTHSDSSPLAFLLLTAGC